MKYEVVSAKEVNCGLLVRPKQGSAGEEEMDTSQLCICGTSVSSGCAQRYNIPAVPWPVLWPNVDLNDFSRAHPKTNHAALAVHAGCKTPAVGVEQEQDAVEEPQRLHGQRLRLVLA